MARRAVSFVLLAVFALGAVACSSGTKTSTTDTSTSSISVAPETTVAATVAPVTSPPTTAYVPPRSLYVPPPTTAYVPPATAAPTGGPGGATALCNDGTYSYAANHQGACSHHGGVAQFYK